MGNYLKMSDKRRVLALLELGWPYRRIERETGVRRETIARYDPRRQPKAANVSTGSDVSVADGGPNAANLSAGLGGAHGPPGLAAPFRVQIEAGLRHGLTAQRIWQDLCTEVAYPHSYASVRRYVRRLKQAHPKLHAGRRLELHRSPTDLVSLARECVARHQHTSESHRLRFETRIAELVGSWDAARLERVLANLLANAVKYSPSGGAVAVKVSREADWAILSVTDRGIGILAADLPHIVQRFRRASNVARQIAGSGLGLAGARDIVEQHGGTISVRSEEGRGSTFVVRLPLVFEREIQSAAQPTP